jgi:outer membrane protein assembly factor BamB
MLLKFKRVWWFMSLALLGLVLSACGRLPAVSYPGLAADGETVYMANAQFVYAIDLNTGTQQWKYPQKAEGGRMFYAPPALTEDMLIVADYSLPGVVTGVSLAGQEMWRFNGASGHYIAAPVVVADKILAANADHYLYALDLDGNLLWKFATQGALWASPATDGQRAYLPSMDHNLYAIDLVSGKPVWTYDLGAAALFQPTLAEDGTLYITSLSNEVVALNSLNGTLKWKKMIDARLWTQAALVDGKLYVGDMSGIAHILSATDGTELETIALDQDGSGVVGAPAVLEDGLVFALQKADSVRGGKLVKLSFADNRKVVLFTMPEDGKFYNGPMAAADVLMIGIVNGKTPVIATNLNGNQIWSFQPAK